MVSYIRCCSRAHFTGRAKCCDNCDCDERREAQATYMRNYRALVKAREKGLGKLRAVPDNSRSAPAPKSTTTVETQYPLGVIGKNAVAEIARIPDANERNPLMVAMIMRLASEIDRGEVVQLSSAVNTIQRMMNELRAQAPPVQAGPAAVTESPQDRFWSDWSAAGS